MQCPSCGQDNNTNYQFCMRCGATLVVRSSQTATQVEQQEAPLFRSVEVQTSMAPTTTAAPSRRSPSRTDPSSQSRSEQPVPMMLQPGAGFERIEDRFGDGRKTFAALNIWGPFAGYGTRRRHVGWLMDGRGDRQEELVQKVEIKFQQRQVPGTYISHQVLTERGVLVERRPYFILKRGLVSLALNIAQFGQDLFISLASYLRPPISMFRVLVLLGMLGFWFFMAFVFPSMLESSSQDLIHNLNPLGGGGASPNVQELLVMLCILGPLGFLNSLALFFFWLFSFYKWVKEKDFWAGLRVSPNEFDEDDLMALEKAVEQTVRMALDEIGLDPTDLKPIETGFSRRVI